MNLFDPNRPTRSDIRQLLSGGMVPMLHVRPDGEDTVKVMVFLQTRGTSSHKDFSTFMPTWRLSSWVQEWIEDPEYVCKRDFGYTGPEPEAPKEEHRKVSLEELGLMLEEDMI